MKPLKILLFIAAVFSILFAISLVFPKDGISLGNEFHLQFMSSTDLFHRDSLPTAYTDSIILNADVTDDPEYGEIDSVFMLTDTIRIEEVAINLDSIIREKIDSISGTVHSIEYSERGRGELYSFFAQAEQSERSGKLLRVLHYGDSQIENDRMTSLLRYRFQKLFGGSGCGIVPAIPLYFGNPTFKEEYAGDWVRYTGFGKRDSTLEHNCFGMMGCFTSIPEPREKLMPALQFKFLKGRRASRFSTLNIYLHSYADSGFIAMHFNDTISDTIIISEPGYEVLTHRLDFNANDIKLEFYLPKGGRIYGIGFDPESGVQFDNIAMRGSSGLEFSKSDSLTLDTMINNLNPGMLIMQFGGNVVPYIQYPSYYKKAFKRELNYLKKLFPGVAILVIGPSDMSEKNNGKFITFPMLEPVSNALREAALETGCSFWDMYEAMGGQNSMQNFVLADPPLASTDYIHFTAKGANMMAGMFFDALMLEYGRYKSSGQ